MISQKEVLLQYKTDIMIRDRIVFGMTDSSARKRLFIEKQVTLKQAVQTIQTSERADDEFKRMGHEGEVISLKKTSSQRKSDNRASTKSTAIGN